MIAKMMIDPHTSTVEDTIKGFRNEEIALNGCPSSLFGQNTGEIEFEELPPYDVFKRENVGYTISDVWTTPAEIL